MKFVADNNTCMIRFPEDSLYVNRDTWKMIRIGEDPLGFGECSISTPQQNLSVWALQ